jgi:Taurine catabolism dioxygenase TauD, TfdA family
MSMTGLGRRFGSLNVHEFVGAVADYPEIIDVRKEAEDHGSNFGGAWHSDVTYLEQPALGSILYAREVPDFGGDTLFANMYLAYDALSDGMRRMLDGIPRCMARVVPMVRDRIGFRHSARWTSGAAIPHKPKSSTPLSARIPKPGAEGCSSTGPSRSASAA